jgi:hypothetical protein
MTKTQYLPAEWLDETVPTPVDQPDDLIRVIDGKCFLIASDEDDEDGEDVWKMEVQDGTFVEFCEFRDYGHWDITVERDGDDNLTWRGDAGIPAEANCFYADGDTDTFADSLEAMFEGMLHYDADLLLHNPYRSGTFNVHAYHWSEAKPWYFAIVDDCAHFSPPGTFGSEAVH